MKRADAVLMLAEHLIELYGKRDVLDDADSILAYIEKMGMQPPELTQMWYNALSDVYVYPNASIWQEEVEKDERVVARYKARTSK